MPILSTNGRAYDVRKIEKSTVEYWKIKKNIFFGNNFITVKSWLKILGDSESCGSELSVDIQHLGWVKLFFGSFFCGLELGGIFLIVMV
jgi:hypothetical protein